MTDAELNDRLERLSDEDLQELIRDPLRNPLRRYSWLTLYRRLAREILDLRMQLSIKYRNEGEVYQLGLDHSFLHTCSIVRDVLDGRDNGSGVASEPWESVRRRLLALAQSNIEKFELLKGISEAHEKRRSESNATNT